MLDTLSTDERVMILAALSTMWLGLTATPERADACLGLIRRIIGARTIVLNLPEGMR